MIGDGTPLTAIHPVLENVIPQPMEPENFAVQPMELVIATPATDPSIGEVADAPDEPEVTAASLPLIPAPVPPGTE